MRILIVGAGIGGLTLAALLRRWRVQPDVIDRAPSFDRRIHALPLSARQPRAARPAGVRRLRCRERADEHLCRRRRQGEIINRYDLDIVSDRFGPIRQIGRAELLALLSKAAGKPPVRMGVSIEAIDDRGNEVAASTSDGETRTYDLVVGAGVRPLVFGDSAVYDTGWGGWVWWADPALLPHDTVTEYWGAGRFLGVYPTKQRIGVVACGPVTGSAARAANARRRPAVGAACGVDR